MLNANTINQTDALARFHGTHTNVVVDRPKKRVSDKAKNNVLSAVIAHKGINRLQLIKRTGLGKETVRYSLERLLEEKKISRVAIAAQGKYTIYTYFECGKEVKVLTINEQMKVDVLAYLERNEQASNNQLAKDLKATVYRINMVTKSLRKSGKITTIKCMGDNGSIALVHKLGGSA